MPETDTVNYLQRAQTYVFLEFFSCLEFNKYCAIYLTHIAFIYEKSIKILFKFICSIHLYLINCKIGHHLFSETDFFFVILKIGERKSSLGENGWVADPIIVTRTTINVIRFIIQCTMTMALSFNIPFAITSMPNSTGHRINNCQHHHRDYENDNQLFVHCNFTLVSKEIKIENMLVLFYFILDF